MRSLATATILGLTILSTGTAAGELLGDPMAGRRLAENVCSACHVIAPGHTSTTDVEAPTFPELANTPRVTALSLRVFLQTPHERMPDLHLDRDETDNVIAYILSLEE
ncbi:MAG: c-type cytochrome [Geminicoccaceae bacterium]